jgi:uncharacterized membrane protein YdfJ with MMPL/SSD domain
LVEHELQRLRDAVLGGLAPSFAPTLGLGAGIDYALLIVGRYREQLAGER